MSEEIRKLIDEYVKANTDHDWDKAHKIFLQIRELEK